MPNIRTKAALLARIARGPAAVQTIYTVTRYLVSVPGDHDPNAGVWISLSPDHRYIIEDYATAHAYVEGREVRLTHRETDDIARLVARKMKLRATPWRSSAASRDSTRRNTDA